jgi:hypothetical protein
MELAAGFSMENHCEVLEGRDHILFNSETFISPAYQFL